MQTFKFVPTARNTGPITINGRVVRAVHPNGEPVYVSDLEVGAEYEIDQQGVLRKCE